MTKYDIFDWIKENCFHCMTVFSLFWNKLLGDISLFPEKLKVACVQNGIDTQKYKFPT